MNRINKTITINAPVAAVFDYIRDPSNLLKLCANLNAVEDVQPLPNGGRSFQWEYKMANVQFLGTSRTTECRFNQRMTNVLRGGISGTVTWLFAHEELRTHVTLIIEYSLPIQFLMKHGENMLLEENESATVVVLENLKTNIEQIRGQIIILEEQNA